MKLRVVSSLVLLAAVGCTGKNADAPQDACKLFSEKTAESILGVALDRASSQAFGENARQTAISNCLFVANGGAEQLKTLSFTVRNDPPQERSVGSAENQIKTMKEEFGERYDIKRVDSLGDSAVYEATLRQLTVFKGRTTYVWAATGAAENVESKLVDLASKTLG